MILLRNVLSYQTMQAPWHLMIHEKYNTDKIYCQANDWLLHMLLIGWAQATSQFQNYLINHQDDRKGSLTTTYLFPKMWQYDFIAYWCWCFCEIKSSSTLEDGRCVNSFCAPLSNSLKLMVLNHHLSTLGRLQMLESCWPWVKNLTAVLFCFLVLCFFFFLLYHILW